jgi:hypothetical protein
MLLTNKVRINSFYRKFVVFSQQRNRNIKRQV